MERSGMEPWVVRQRHDQPTDMGDRAWATNVVENVICVLSAAHFMG